MRRRFDYIDLFYRQKLTLNSLPGHLDYLLRAERVGLSVIPFATAAHVTELFTGLDKRRKVTGVEQQDENVWRLRMQYSIQDRTRAETIDGEFLVTRNPEKPHLHAILCIEQMNLVYRALLPLVRTHPRSFYLTILSQSTLLDLLHGYRESGGWNELRVKRASLVSRYERKNADSSKSISSVTWPDLSLDQAFDLAEEQHGWFRSLTFQLMRGRVIEGEVTVRRDGVMRTDACVQQLFAFMVEPIHRIIQNNLKLFEHRSRKEQTRLDVRPLAVRYRDDAFVDAEERERLVAVMRQYERSSVSVAHHNPYLELSVVDYEDGSTFDLWVVNSSELVIVPQLRATVSAIRRLVGHLFNGFDEGDVSDFSPR